MYQIVYTKKAAEDIPKLKAAKLDKRAKALIEVIRENPYQIPPPYEKLMGDLQGAYSRRINLKHRLVYEVLEKEQTVKIISLWTHYEFQQPVSHRKPVAAPVMSTDQGKVIDYHLQETDNRANCSILP